MRSLTSSSAGPPGPFSCTSETGLPTRPAVISPISTNSQAGTSIPPNPFFSVRNDTLLLSSQAKDNVSRAIQSSWADSTLKRYTGSIKQYIRFCNAERIPERLRFPADEFILCAFAASSFGRHAGGTPRGHLSALKAWHLTHNVEWKGSPRLRYVLNGVHNFAPGSSKRPPRPPVTRRMLSQLVGNLDLSSPLDAAVAACATTAFWGQCRIGELLPLSTSRPLPPLPSRSDFKRSVRNPQSCILRLPVTKTHRHGQDVVLVDQRAPINPVSLLKNHIRVSNIQGDAYIFSYATPNGSSTLTKNLFIQRCNAIWSRLGYPRTTGHSFRIGGTTELLIAGTPPEVVRATGRWSSESFMRYWRSLEDIVPLHIRYLHPARGGHRHRR